MLEPIFENMEFRIRNMGNGKSQNFRAEVQKIKQEKKRRKWRHRKECTTYDVKTANVCEKSIPGIQTSTCKPAEAEALSG